MKKVLMLGGAFAQIPAIKYAKDAGYYVITCDYLPNNPGHEYADEYHNVSTTDLDGVFNLARSLDVDGIVAYASDPAAVTASYVSEKLGLPGNSFKTTKILSEKDRFREFLRDHNFNTPKIHVFSENEDIHSGMDLSYPLVVKPVDSSGSKGVTVIQKKSELNNAISYAQKYSRSKKVIIEEFIGSPFNQIHGDCFVLNGSIIMYCLGDHQFKENTLAPYSTTLPSVLSEIKINSIKSEISRFINLAGFKNGAINIEVRIGYDDKIYLIDIGARNGGNFIPQLVCHATGFDEVTATVEAALGNYDAIDDDGEYAVNNCCSHYIVGSEKDGIVKEICYSEKIKKMIVEEHLYKKPGDSVDCFRNSGNTVGVLILRYSGLSEMESIINSIGDHVKVIVE